MNNNNLRSIAMSIIAIFLFGVTSVASAGDKVWSLGTPIVTYYAGPGREVPQTNASATQLAEGGWNLVWASTVEELNTAQAHGLLPWAADSIIGRMRAST